MELNPWFDLDSIKNCLQNFFGILIKSVGWSQPAVVLLVIFKADTQN